MSTIRRLFLVLDTYQPLGMHWIMLECIFLTKMIMRCTSSSGLLEVSWVVSFGWALHIYYLRFCIVH